MEKGFLIFFGKREKTEKTCKNSCMFWFPQCLCKNKKEHDFSVSFTKILLVATGTFSKLFRIEKTAKAKPTFWFLLL